MMPTPIPADTATTRAAVATPVLERETTTPRAAIFPMAPMTAPIAGPRTLASSITAAGTSRV